jgi:predicted RNA-binding Zn-ribbon protein involved in translation (DUF1610 family)
LVEKTEEGSAMATMTTMTTIPELQREIRERAEFMCPSCGLAELTGPFSAPVGTYYECPACARRVTAHERSHGGKGEAIDTA